jgi:hypothetical protein
VHSDSALYIYPSCVCVHDHTSNSSSLYVARCSQFLMMFGGKGGGQADSRDFHSPSISHLSVGFLSEPGLSGNAFQPVAPHEPQSLKEFGNS